MRPDGGIDYLDIPGDSSFAKADRLARLLGSGEVGTVALLPERRRTVSPHR